MWPWKKIGLVFLLLVIVPSCVPRCGLSRFCGLLAVSPCGAVAFTASTRRLAPIECITLREVKGPRLIFVHGLEGESLNWAQQMLDLRSRFHVYAIDLLGHGQTQQPTSRIPSSSSRDAAAVSRYPEHQVCGPGRSFDGRLDRSETCHEHPEVVNRLVIADAAGLKFQTNINAQSFLPRTPEELTAFMAVLTPRQYHLPYIISRDLLHQFAQQAWITRRIFDSMSRIRTCSTASFKESHSCADYLGERGKADSDADWRADEAGTAGTLPCWFCTDSGHLAVYECWKKLEPRL